MATRAASASLRAASLRAAAAASSSRRFKRAAALAASFSALRAFDSARFALFGPFVLGADTDASFSSLGDPAVLSSRLARAAAGVFGVFGASSRRAPFPSRPTIGLANFRPPPLTNPPLPNLLFPITSLPRRRIASASAACGVPAADGRPLFGFVPFGVSIPAAARAGTAVDGRNIGLGPSNVPTLTENGFAFDPRLPLPLPALARESSPISTMLTPLTIAPARGPLSLDTCRKEKSGTLYVCDCSHVAAQRLAAQVAAVAPGRARPS